MKKILFACGVMLCCVGFAFANCNGDECSYDYNPDGKQSKICQQHGLSKGADCSEYMEGAKSAICINNEICAAKECYDDNEHGNYLLWLHKDATTGKYVSYGGCREISWLQDRYCKNNCECGSSDYTCKVVKRDLPDYLKGDGRGGKAYFGDKVCECQKKTCEERYAGRALQCCRWIEEENREGVTWNSKHTDCTCTGNKELQSDGTCKEEEKPNDCEGFPNSPAGRDCCEKHKKNPLIIWKDDRCTCEGGLELQGDQCVEKKEEKPKDCFYEFTTVQKCKNGKIIAKFVRYPVDEEFMKKLKLVSCSDQNELQRRIEEDKGLFDELVKKICAESNSLYVRPDESVGAAARIDAFMLSASSDRNLSVWKDAEGNFNRSRLVSDATAGVVLGTVGGIVSANVIKKKQLEKGFDALNCSVGGQKVADWGDEFSVGMRRY